MFRREAVDHASCAPHGRVRWRHAQVGHVLATSAAFTASVVIALGLEFSVTSRPVEARASGAGTHETPPCGDSNGLARMEISVPRRWARSLRAGDELSLGFGDGGRSGHAVHGARVLGFRPDAHAASLMVIEASVRDLAKCGAARTQAADGAESRVVEVATPPQSLGTWLFRRLLNSPVAA